MRIFLIKILNSNLNKGNLLEGVKYAHEIIRDWTCTPF